MSTPIKSGSSTDLATVNSDKELTIAPTKSINKAGYVISVFENDNGSENIDANTPQIRSPRVCKDDRLAVGVDNELDMETFNSVAQNTGKFMIVPVTMTASFASGFMNLNASAINTINTGVYKSTKQWFSLPSGGSLNVEKLVQLSAIGATNTEIYDGWFVPNTATTNPLDGVYFKIGNGIVEGIINNAGVEVSTGNLLFAPVLNTTFKIKLIINNRSVDFYIDDKLRASIAAGPAIANISLSPSAPICSQIRILAVVASAATTYKVGNYVVWVSGVANGRDYTMIKASQGASYQGQSGHTQGTIANYANSANPTAAVPTNTTAALGSGLGGQFWETDTLAVTTDGIICSYQNPVGTINIPGKTMLVYGVTINSFIQTALTGGGYNAQWSIAAGHTAVSLATTEGQNTKASRRIPVGSNSVASGLVAITQLAPINSTFKNPILVQPGEFFQLVKKKVGTAPSAGVVAHVITVDHIFID